MKIIENVKNETILKKGDMAVIRNEEEKEEANVIMLHGDNENIIKLVEEKTTFNNGLTRNYITLYINKRYIAWYAGFVLCEVSHNDAE